MKLPPDPYSSIPTKLRVKLQSYVPEIDKDLLVTICPDRNIYTLLLNHALKRAVDFIITNHLTYCPADSERLLNFIVTGADNGLRQHAVARPAGDTVPRDGAGATTGVGATLPSAANQSTVLRQGNPSRRRRGKESQD